MQFKSEWLGLGPAASPPEGIDPLIVQLIRFATPAVSVIGLLIAAILATATPVQYDRVGLHVGIGVLGLTALVFSRNGHYRVASHLMIWGCWAVVTWICAINGGMRGPSLLNYPVLIVFSGWLLGSRPTRWLVGLTICVVLALVWADYAGWTSPPDYSSRLVYLVYLCGILFLTASATLMSRKSYLQQFAHSEQRGNALADRERELRKLHLAVEQSAESIVITDAQLHIEYANDAFMRSTSYALHEVVGQDPRILISEQSRDTVHQEMTTVLAQGRTWRAEVVSRRKDGSEFVESVVMSPIRQADGVVSHYVQARRDLTDVRLAQARINHLAQFDVLTGLPNRTQFLECTTHAIAQTLHRGNHLGILLFNVDRFKNVNDARGAEVGDALLVAVAGRLKSLLRSGDVLARLAGDEYAVLLNDLGNDAHAANRNAQAMARRIHNDLQRALNLGFGEELSISASLGVALTQLSTDYPAAEVLRHATTALHEAKQSGGGQTVFFGAEMDAAAQLRFRVERELRHAISANELRLYLQPQVDAEQRVVGAEALVRWQHPQRGLVFPGGFIAIAEESDLIVQLDRWVFEQSCQLLAQQAAVGHNLHLSVNLSPRHFSQPHFVRWLKALLLRTGADPRQLTLEVTEGLVINDVESVIAKMVSLTALGVQFSIDDFGTGYSSLAYLKRLPVRELKIDKSFVQEAPNHADDAVLVDTILAVATHMGLRVVAEGVETLEQAQFLAARHADVIYQGYLYGKPQPAQAWLQAWAGTNTHV